jgi:hypothetical protein
MRWDSSRPVPWRRLVKEWLIYAAIMTVVLALVYRDGNRLVPILAGLFVSGPLYLGLGFVLAKFGYVRKTLADMRTPRAATSSGDAASAGGEGPRPRPAPTRRTSTGPNRPKRKRR